MNARYTPIINVIDDKPAVTHSVAHLTVEQNTCHRIIDTNTMKSLNSHSNNNCGSLLENLPKKFVSSMRTLFDIMDDKRSGFVTLSDIEARWQDDGSKGLPYGVIDCLRRVTPTSGMLSFERFCAGLKICLLRNQANDCKISSQLSVDGNNSGKSSGCRSSSSSCSSSNNHNNNNNNNIDNSKSNSTNNDSNNNKSNNNSIKSDVNNNNDNNGKIDEDDDDDEDENEHTVGAEVKNINDAKNNREDDGGNDDDDDDDDDDDENNNINYTKEYSGSNGLAMPVKGNTNKATQIFKRPTLSVQRTLSLPKLSPSSDGDSLSDPCTMAPPKPPRTALIMSNRLLNVSDSRSLDKAEIKNALQNWQMNVIMNEDKKRAMEIPSAKYTNRGIADGSTNSMNLQLPLLNLQSTSQQHLAMPPANQKPTQTIYPTNRSPTLMEFQKKGYRQREIRRHTLQNAIDHNMLKRIRHYEEEKNLLKHGLHAVEKAQQWYFKQISAIQEKMQLLNHGEGHLEQLFDEQLDLKRMRITEMNRYLNSLEESWERNHMNHMNLAIRGAPQFLDIQMNQLKMQNRQLTEEVSQKSERITDLEMERKSLYRELLQLQQQSQQLQQQLLQKPGNEEVIF